MSSTERLKLAVANAKLVTDAYRVVKDRIRNCADLTKEDRQAWTSACENLTKAEKEVCGAAQAVLTETMVELYSTRVTLYPTDK